jgi:hypothetical protein
VRVPAEGTTRWGMLIIISVQIYFWLHLRERAQKLRLTEPGLEVAWIGVYQSMPARVMFVLSGLGLPIIAVVCLGIRAAWLGHFPWWEDAVFILPVLVSGAIAWLTWRQTPIGYS